MEPIILSGTPAVFDITRVGSVSSEQISRSCFSFALFLSV